MEFSLKTLSDREQTNYFTLPSQTANNDCGNSLIKHIVSVNEQNVPRHCGIDVDQVSYNCLSRALHLQNFFLTAKKHL